MSPIPPTPNECDAEDLRRKLLAGEMPNVDAKLREGKLLGIQELRKTTGMSLSAAKAACDVRHRQLVQLGKLRDTGFLTPQDEIRFWRELAIHMADCTAATAGHEGTLKSCSKVRRERHASICRRIANALDTMYFDRYRNHGRTRHDVAKRCHETADELDNETSEDRHG